MNIFLFFIITILFFIFNTKKRYNKLKYKRRFKQCIPSKLNKTNNKNYINKNKKGKIMKKVRFNNKPQVRVIKEQFYGNAYKGDYNLDDEYYIDKLGTKGYLYNKIDDTKECNSSKNINEIKNFNDVVHKLELYNNNFYNTLEEYDYDELKKPSCIKSNNHDGNDIGINKPCQDNIRLDFNQGILYSTNDQYKLGL